MRYPTDKLKEGKHDRKVDENITTSCAYFLLTGSLCTDFLMYANSQLETAVSDIGHEHPSVTVLLRSSAYLMTA